MNEVAVAQEKPVEPPVALSSFADRVIADKAGGMQTVECMGCGEEVMRGTRHCGNCGQCVGCD